MHQLLVRLLLCILTHVMSQTALGFLRVFMKLQKASISFVMSVCLLVHMQQLKPYHKDFHEI